MYKIELWFFSLTWVELKFNFQLNTNAEAHVQSQTQLLEFDLSLTKIQFTIEKPVQDHMYKVELNFLSLIWIELELNLQLATNPAAHVQSQTKNFEFDLSD